MRERAVTAGCELSLGGFFFLLLARSVCVCMCVCVQEGEMQAAAVLSFLAQILTDLFIVPSAFSAILLSLLSSLQDRRAGLSF